MLYTLPTGEECNILYKRIILDTAQTATKADNPDFKQEQNKSTLRLGHYWKIGNIHPKVNFPGSY